MLLIWLAPTEPILTHLNFSNKFKVNGLLNIALQKKLFYTATDCISTNIGISIKMLFPDSDPRYESNADSKQWKH